MVGRAGALHRSIRAMHTVPGLAVRQRVAQRPDRDPGVVPAACCASTPKFPQVVNRHVPAGGGEIRSSFPSGG